MDTPIISRDLIREKARAAFALGRKRHEHNFNWHSTAAISVWLDEWDRCNAAAPHAHAVVKLAMGCPP